MSLADEMPLTADYVAEKRKEWGADHVRSMVAAAMLRGERNRFWAVEHIKPTNGDQSGFYRTVGAPFDRAQGDDYLLKAAVMYGMDFYGVMCPPDGVAPTGPGS